MLRLVLAAVAIAVPLALAYLTLRDPRGRTFTSTGDTLLEDLLGDALARRVHLALATTCTAAAVLLAVQLLTH
jgi:hypothetical protein